MTRALLIICLVTAVLGTSLSAPSFAEASTTASTDKVTTTRALPRGTIIKARDVTGPYAEDDYVGQELVRAMREGAVLTPRHVRVPLYVKRNETVTLIYRQGALSMETMGRSLGEGALGDRVTIMNLSSRKRIMGRITGPGQVEVTP